MRHRAWCYLVVFAAVMALPGCFKYSFTGAKKLENVETVQIDQFSNIATLVNPQLATDLSETVRDVFVRQSNLSLVDRDGDIHLTGRIQKYTIRPANVNANDQANQNRLIIEVVVEYKNRVYPDLGWTNTFTQFADYNQDQDLSSVETELLEDINSRLAQDIFNKTLADW